MNLSRREQLAAAAMTGLIMKRFGSHEMCVIESYRLADLMLALSAPDAIEALKTLVEAVKYMGLSYDSYVSKTVREAEAVLARYEEPKE